VSPNCDAECQMNGTWISLMYNTTVRLEESMMNKYIVSLLVVIGLSACSGPEDALENVGEIVAPDQLSGCVTRNVDGSCDKAVCVADEESDCKSFVKACEKHEHIVDVRYGHDTCERREAEPDS
jgi:hypothetical protein